MSYRRSGVDSLAGYNLPSSSLACETNKRTQLLRRSEHVQNGVLDRNNNTDRHSNLHNGAVNANGINSKPTSGSNTSPTVSSAMEATRTWVRNSEPRTKAALKTKQSKGANNGAVTTIKAKSFYESNDLKDSRSFNHMRSVARCYLREFFDWHAPEEPSTSLDERIPGAKIKVLQKSSSQRLLYDAYFHILHVNTHATNHNHLAKPDDRDRVASPSNDNTMADSRQPDLAPDEMCLIKFNLRDGVAQVRLWQFNDDGGQCSRGQQQPVNTQHGDIGCAYASTYSQTVYKLLRAVGGARQYDPPFIFIGAQSWNAVQAAVAHMNRQTLRQRPDEPDSKRLCTQHFFCVEDLAAVIHSAVNNLNIKHVSPKDVSLGETPLPVAHACLSHSRLSHAAHCAVVQAKATLYGLFRAVRPTSGHLCLTPDLMLSRSAFVAPNTAAPPGSTQPQKTEQRSATSSGGIVRSAPATNVMGSAVSRTMQLLQAHVSWLSTTQPAPDTNQPNPETAEHSEQNGRAPPQASRPMEPSESSTAAAKLNVSSARCLADPLWCEAEFDEQQQPSDGQQQQRRRVGQGQEADACTQAGSAHQHSTHHSHADAESEDDVVYDDASDGKDKVQHWIQNNFLARHQNAANCGEEERAPVTADWTDAVTSSTLQQVICSHTDATLRLLQPITQHARSLVSKRQQPGVSPSRPSPCPAKPVAEVQADDGLLHLQSLLTNAGFSDPDPSQPRLPDNDISLSETATSVQTERSSSSSSDQDSSDERSDSESLSTKTSFADRPGVDSLAATVRTERTCTRAVQTALSCVTNSAPLAFGSISQQPAGLSQHFRGFGRGQPKQADY